MEIIVEIGTEEQKELIKKDLQIIDVVHTALKGKARLHVIVPEDFDATVNRLEGTDGYVSGRESCVVMGKHIPTGDSTYLVFSKTLFNNRFSEFFRLHAYLHELFHSLNSYRFPDLKTTSASGGRYLVYLNIFFDEFYVEKKTTELILGLCPKVSFRGKKEYCRAMRDFVKTALDEKYYSELKENIERYFLHRNVRVLHKDIEETFDGVAKAIVYAYAFMSNSSRFDKYHDRIKGSHFVNNKTIVLINYFSAKYGNNSFDLSDGVPLMADFLENFGIRYEDGAGGLLCHVKRI